MLIRLQEPEVLFTALFFLLPPPLLTFALNNCSLFYFSSVYCVSTPCIITINNQQDRTCGTRPHLGCVVSNLVKRWQPKHLHAPCHNALHIYEFHNRSIQYMKYGNASSWLVPDLEVTSPIY